MFFQIGGTAAELPCGRRRIPRFRARAARPDLHKETPMIWQTPQACDMRFGFEITMYVAAR